MSATSDDLVTILERHCVMLREHFSSVQIIAVREDSTDGTVQRFSSGKGSFYERIGATRHWLIQEDSKEKAIATREIMEGGDDD